MLRLYTNKCQGKICKYICAKKCYYQILGVSKNASLEEIKESYIQLSKKYHPDNCKTGNENQIKLINEAYSVLSKPNEKSLYDAKLSGHNNLRYDSNYHYYHQQYYYEFNENKYRNSKRKEYQLKLTKIYVIIGILVLMQLVRIHFYTYHGLPIAHKYRPQSKDSRNKPID